MLMVCSPGEQVSKFELGALQSSLNRYSVHFQLNNLCHIPKVIHVLHVEAVVEKRVYRKHWDHEVWLHADNPK
jgi:hypothetical protein